MLEVVLSRRNLTVLLNKLDRNKAEPGSSHCTILKGRGGVPLIVRAEEDDVHYKDGPAPGVMHPADVPRE